MTRQQLRIIEFAYADLIGSYQAHKLLDVNSHDWVSHLETIQDMEKSFSFLDTPELDIHNHGQISGMVIECSCKEIIESRCNELYYTINPDGFPDRNSDGSLVIQKKGGLPYSDAPNKIKKEIVKFVKAQLTEENKHKTESQKI